MYSHYFDYFKRRNSQFELQETSYTKRLVTNTETIFFNHEGKADPRVLLLINKVRNDGKKYLLKQNEPKDLPIDYYSLISKPRDGLMIKVDITAAYWTFGLHEGIISEMTDRCLKEVFKDDDYDTVKKARTKAFGSLATKKTITQYQNGQKQEPEYFTEPTRELYIDVCRGIDQIMKQCAKEVDGCVYYYWDCMFVVPGFEQKVVDFFAAKNYHCKISESEIMFVRIGDTGYLVSLKDGKTYMTRRENKHLLDVEQYKY